MLVEHENGHVGQSAQVDKLVHWSSCTGVGLHIENDELDKGGAEEDGTGQEELEEDVLGLHGRGLRV